MTAPVTMTQIKLLLLTLLTSARQQLTKQTHINLMDTTDLLLALKTSSK